MIKHSILRMVVPPSKTDRMCILYILTDGFARNKCTPLHKKHVIAGLLSKRSNDMVS